MEKLKMCFNLMPFFICMIFFCFNSQIFSPFEIILYTIVVVLFFSSVFNFMFSMLILLDEKGNYKKW